MIRKNFVAVFADDVKNENKLWGGWAATARR